MVKKPKKVSYRHPILDRKDRIIAFSQETMSVYVDPLKVTDDATLERYFPGITVKLTKARAKNQRFLWAQRHCDERIIGEIKKLRLAGTYFKNDQKRVCIKPEIFSRVIGFCDQDLDGKAGIEYGLNQQLFSSPIALTLDFGLQCLLHKKLTQALSDFDGDDASGIIIEIPTGNILAMVSLPATKEPRDFIRNECRNRIIDPVEVGSVLKLINIANALDSGFYSPYSVVDARGPLKIGDYEINDFFGVNQEITLRESLWRSSNIANARVALDLGPAYQRQKFMELGMFEPIRLYPSSVARTILPKYSLTATATLSYGYGIGLTILHLAKSIMAVTTGYAITPKLVRGQDCARPTRVYKRETVREVLSMMEDVVQKQNRKTLSIADMRIGAKTGTANMVVNGKYVEGKNFVTLVTVLPADAPKLLIILQMTNPKKERLKSGKFTTAANVLNQYMRELISMG